MQQKNVCHAKKDIVMQDQGDAHFVNLIIIATLRMVAQLANYVQKILTAMQDPLVSLLANRWIHALILISKKSLVPASTDKEQLNIIGFNPNNVMTRILNLLSYLSIQLLIADLAEEDNSQIIKDYANIVRKASTNQKIIINQIKR